MTYGRCAFSLHRRMAVHKNRKRSLKISEAIQEVVTQAFQQDRIVQGILDVTEQLHRCPSEVLFVVLEQADDDKKEHKIQQKLVEAYCRENRVKLVKVNECSKLLSFHKNDSRDINMDDSSYTDKHTTSETPTLEHNFAFKQKPRNYSLKQAAVTRFSLKSDDKDDECDSVKCILVLKPKVPSSEDMFLTAFHDTLVSNNLIQCPFIRI